MEAGDTRVADPVDAVHHEMDSAVHIVTVFINLCITSKSRISRLREGACQPSYMRNLHDLAVINDSQIVGLTSSEIYSKITGYYTT